MIEFNLKNGIKRALFNITWRCNVCDKEIFTGDYFCCDCNDNLPFIKSDFCNHCGRLTSYSVEFCDSCKQKNLNFDMARSVFSYENAVKKLVHGFKYYKKLYLREVFSYYLTGVLLNNFSDANLITFVPSTKKRLKERGYNQSKALAEELSRTINIPCIEVCQKIKDTDRQATLNADERLDNLRGSFKITSGEVKNKNIVIVDDVLTTGATTDYIARLLKKAGATKVYVLTIASVGKFKYFTSED